MPGIDTDYHLTNAETGVQVIAAVRRQLDADELLSVLRELLAA